MEAERPARDEWRDAAILAIAAAAALATCAVTVFPGIAGS